MKKVWTGKKGASAVSVECRIKKDFGSFCLDVDFSAGEETLALLGASGSGKSMTLRCIAGVVKPDEGRIVIGGRVVFDSRTGVNLPPQKRETGLLFQDYALFPNMTVEENIRMGARRAGRQADELVRSACRDFHLEGLEHHRPGQLSGGQKQRCALARIMVSRPKILMLDEPFSALDSHLRWQLEQELAPRLRDFGGTVILVSHDRDEVFRLSRRVAVLRQGQVDCMGSREELFGRPPTVTSALLTGCKNIFPLEADGSSPEGWSLPCPLETGSTEARFLGIRPGDILPETLCPPQAEALRFSYEILDKAEDTAGVILTIRPEGALGISLRWELSRSLWEEIRVLPPRAAVRRENLLFLRP